MRLDKYMWAVRIFKTRTSATTGCREGRVTIDGEAVKPSRTVKVGEEIVLRKGAVYFRWKVLAFPRSRVGAKLAPEYVLDITPEEEKHKLEMIRLGQEQRPKGIGRPTKRQRRDWDKFFK